MPKFKSDILNNFQVKHSCQTGHFKLGKNRWKTPKLKCDFFGDFQTMCADRQVRKNLLRSSQSWFCNIQMHFRHMWLFLLFAQVMLAYTLELGGHSILCPPCPNPKFKMKTLPQHCATFDF